MKAMFLTNDMFFYQLDIELQCVRWNENSILWFLFCLHLKSHPHSQFELPVAITNILYLSVPELENSVFLDLVLLCDTAVASHPFYCPSWRSTPTSSSATLSRTCFWIFLPSGIQSGKETDIGRQHLNLSSLSLFSFSELNKALDTWWRVLISLHKTATNSVRPVLVSQYSIGNPSLSHVQFRKNHIKRAGLLWGLKTSSQFQYNTLRTKFDTQTTVISHRRRKRFSSSAGLLFRVSSAITNRTQDLAIRESCFYISVKI